MSQTASTTQGRVHHVEVFKDDRTGKWGWQCFTCLAEQSGFANDSAACLDSDNHEGACRCESH